MSGIARSFIRKYRRTPETERKSLVAKMKTTLARRKQPEASLWTKLRKSVNVKSLATDFVCIYVENFVRTVVHRAAEYLGIKSGNKIADKKFPREPKDRSAMDVSGEEESMDLSEEESMDVSEEDNTTDEETEDGHLKTTLTFTQNGKIIKRVDVTDE
jgi:hypothetical protein